MSLLSDPELRKYLADPKIVRFCEYCRAYFADPTECFATYNKVEYFYHNLGFVRRTGDSDLRKLRATGLIYSKRVKFSDGKPVIFFYPTKKLVEICKRYLEARKQGDRQADGLAFRALYGTPRRGEGQ